MKIFLTIWNHKQKIVGAVTGITSMFATAELISAQTALLTTTLTGACMILFATVHDIQINKPDA
jgi:hypothetical protein